MGVLDCSQMTAKLLGNDNNDRLLTERELAQRLNVKVRTLRQWRWRGVGPPHLKLGAGGKAPVRYAPSVVAAWLDGAARSNTSDPGGGGDVA